MPQIILGPQQHAPTIDGSVRGKAYAFLAKLAENDTLPGLHIEPIVRASDPRVRTGRVDQFWRAVMFKVQGQAADAMYVYLGVWPHDEATEFAMRAQLQVNPVNGIAELLLADQRPVPVAAFEHLAVEPSTKGGEEEPLLTVLGHSVDDLVSELGLDPALVELAMEVSDPDEMTTLAEAASGWQGIALIDLSAGKSIVQVRESLGIGTTDQEPAASVSPDDQLVTALTQPASQLEFAFVEDDAELRRAIEDQDFAAWRVFLHPEQRRYAERSWNGPFRLSGGAGTGKTVVLLHRARHLARQRPSASILLTTFNKTLADALQRDLRLLDPNVTIAQKMGEPGIWVRGIDSVARSVLQRHSSAAPTAVATVLGSRTPEIASITARNAWSDAIASDGAALDGSLRSPAFFQAEYATIVLPHRITSFEQYAKVRRPGRGVPLDRRARAAVWDVVASYRLGAGIHGSIDFPEAAALAADILDTTGERPFDHVLVDEGQDLGPTHWQLLRALVPQGPDDLFLAEDSHQRIYGHQLVLGRYGIKIVGRSQRLRLNYRTTAQNLRYAVSILAGTDFVDLEEQAEDATDYRSARTGPAPQVIRTDTLDEELTSAADVVSGWLVDGRCAPEAIGILVRTEQAGEQVVRALDQHGTSVRFVQDRTVPTGKPVVLTMHRAKGMEFSRVLIFGADADALPAPFVLQGLTEADRADALRREMSLLYVAATRARDELVIMCTGRGSDLLPGQVAP